MCAKELSVRKNIRLKEYDYSSVGYYFVTICVKDGHELLGKVVGAITNRPHANAHISLWQKSFHDHIIRNEEEYLRICQYIDENPTKWEEDCYYPKETPCKIT